MGNHQLHQRRRRVEDEVRARKACGQKKHRTNEQIRFVNRQTHQFKTNNPEGEFQMKYRRIITFTLMFALTAFIAACSGAGGNSTPTAAYKTAYAAMKNKDIAGLKKVMPGCLRLTNRKMRRLTATRRRCRSKMRRTNGRQPASSRKTTVGSSPIEAVLLPAFRKSSRFDEEPAGTPSFFKV
jgi:hypothetical protein